MNRRQLRLWYDYLMARMNERFGAYERDLFDLNESIRYVFVVSTGRTGTKTLSKVFNNRVEDALSFHEPSPDINELGLVSINGRWSDHRVRSLFNYYRFDILNGCRKSEVRFFVESNNLVCYLLPFIRRNLNDYRIVHVERDGHETVRSMYSKVVRRENGEPVYVFDKKDRRHRINPKVIGEKDPPKDWNDMDRFEKVCYNWSRKEALIRKTIQGDECSMTVPYRGAVAEPEPYIWSRLLNHVGAEGDPERIVEYLSEHRSNQNKEDLLEITGGWTEERERIFQEYRSILGQDQ